MKMEDDGPGGGIFYGRGVEYGGEERMKTYKLYPAYTQPHPLKSRHRLAPKL